MQSPQAATAAIAIGAGLFGASDAAGICASMGGDTPSIILAAVVVLASTVPAIFPALLAGQVRISKWGMTAFFATMIQPLLAAGLGLAVVQIRPVTREAFWIGCLVGALVVLVIQVTWAIRALSRAQREWEHAHAHTEAPKPC